LGIRAQGHPNADLLRTPGDEMGHQTQNPRHGQYRGEPRVVTQDEPERKYGGLLPTNDSNAAPHRGSSIERYVWMRPSP
jgi:hypothetical protein